MLSGNCWDHRCLPKQMMCKNGGLLQKISSAGYKCNCSQTNFQGDTCEAPVVFQAAMILNDVVTVLQHVVTFASISVSEWAGDTQTAYELGYLYSLGLSVDGVTKVSAAVTVSSEASSVRRAGVSVVFTSQVLPCAIALCCCLVLLPCATALCYCPVLLLVLATCLPCASLSE